MEGMENLPSRAEFRTQEVAPQSQEPQATETPSVASIEPQGEQSQEPTQGEETAVAEKQEQSQEPDWVKKRLARQERKHQRELEELQARIRSMESQTAPQEESYEGLSDEQIVERIAEKKAREMIQSLSREQAEVQARQAQAQEIAKREEEFAKANPDYFEVIEDGLEALQMLPASIVDSIRNNPNGHAIAYQLLKDPKAIQGMLSADPISQMTQLVQINLGLQQAPQSQGARAELQRAPSQVPNTPRPNSPASVTKTFDPMNSDIKARERAYLERRKR